MAWETARVEGTVLIVKAQFDGRVFVPEEPVALAAGQAVSLTVEPAEAVPKHAAAPTPLQQLMDRLERLPCAADWPEDAAAEHDHYLYGTPKRP